MLAQWHDLNVIVSIFLQIRNEDIDHLCIGVPAVRFIGRFSERAKVKFVDVQRLISAVGAFLQPFLIMICVCVQIPDDGGACRP